MKQEQLTHIETKLYKIPLFGKKVGLLNINRLMEELENIINLADLFKCTKIIHVTGTNGKGSVSNMISRIYKKQGYSVGLFTSPHIDCITERIQFDNKNVEEDLFVEGYRYVNQIVDKLNLEGLEPTFFEWIYAIALYCFGKMKPDILIIEVGIGGKLDTTNSLPRKDLCIITPIGLDHQNILGDTIKAIAFEKSGIIKEGNKVVIYNNSKEVENIFDQEIARKKAVSYKIFPKSLKILESSHLGIDFSLYNKYYYYVRLRLPVLAKYQLENAAIALTAIEAMKDVLPVDFVNIEEGLLEFHWPGRFEEIKEGLIIDGAHNKLGAETLLESIDAFYLEHKPDLLIGMKEGKNVQEILRVITSSKSFNHCYVVDLTIQKSVPKELIANELKKEYDNVVLVDDLKEFLTNYNYSKKQTLIGAGSLYLISEIRKIILGGLR